MRHVLIVFIAVFSGFFAMRQVFATTRDAEWFPTKLVCISWMDLQTEIKETSINEYAMASLAYAQGDWSYSADVIEGKLNGIYLTYAPAKITVHSYSDQYPVNNLTAELEIDGKKSDVACDLR